MFYAKDEFDTNSQHVIEHKAYVVISDGSMVRRVYRNVYENGEQEFYVYFDGLVVTVECCGEVWFNE